MATVGVFPAALAGLGPLAFACELEDYTVVNQSVDHRRPRHWIGENIRPIGERKVGVDGNALTFVSTRGDLGQQIGCLTFKRNVSKLVDLFRESSLLLALARHEAKRNISMLFGSCRSTMNFAMLLL